MKSKKYQTPVLEIETIEILDVLTASSDANFDISDLLGSEGGLL